MKYKNMHFFSRIQIPAECKVPLSDVKTHIFNHKALELVKDGQKLIYLIKSNSMGYYFSLELSKSEISLITYADEFPIALYDESVYRLLLLIGYMSKIYTVKFESIYPYIIESFKKNNTAQNKFSEVKKQIDVPEIILSKRIIELNLSNKKTSSDLSFYKSTFESVLSKYVSFKYNGKININQLSTDLKINVTKLKSCFSDLNQKDFKVKWLSQSEFILVDK
ncbi:MAG: hypothetical protein ACP5M9_01800 [Candidatus Micrarchaeia archaeon]